jgi:hypothetical protein
MTKWIVAAAMMITAALATAPTRTTDAQSDVDEVATGTCSYSCSSNGKTYINRSQCLSHCTGVCTIEAC